MRRIAFPFFIGTQFGIYPKIDEIPNFLNEPKIIAVFGKSILSGCVAGLSIYKVCEEKTEEVEIAYFEIREELRYLGIQGKEVHKTLMNEI